MFSDDDRRYNEDCLSMRAEWNFLQEIYVNWRRVFSIKNQICVCYRSNAHVYYFTLESKPFIFLTNTSVDSIVSLICFCYSHIIIQIENVKFAKWSG